MIERKEMLWDDLGYIVIFEKENTHIVNYKAYEISEESTLSETGIFLSGHTKYDGCSNVDIDALDSGRLHFCEKQQMIDIGILLGRIYDEAFNLMPEYKGGQ